MQDRADQLVGIVIVPGWHGHTEGLAWLRMEFCAHAIGLHRKAPAHKTPDPDLTPRTRLRAIR
ncbi:hypothetical protein GCM10010994_32390 [Chelatococcus reniformis]|uniref:Uncharacterized protein n=1 Tax=Chelatococcus reniformis TaxID=1494448 RepID=A0A916UFN5_9HYPH|nr:hypothetical protein GCM10010994_32390 [Chelatococcus reniformis]